MFKGLGTVQPFSFTFSNGVVTGPNFSFDLKGIVGGLNDAQKTFYRGNPGMLLDYVYEAWNKQFNANCISAGGSLNLGVTWDVACLTASGTPNLLYAAGQGIVSSVAAWGTSVLGAATTTPPATGGGGTTTGGGTIACTTIGKKPLVGSVCCTGLVKDALGICNAPANTSPPVETCAGTFVCSIPDMYLYIGAGILAFMMMKR